MHGMDVVTSFHSSLVPLAEYERVGYGLCVDAYGLEDYIQYTRVGDYDGYQHRNYHSEGRKEKFNCFSLLPSLAVRRYCTEPGSTQPCFLCEEVSKGMSGGGWVNRRRLPFCSFSCCELLLCLVACALLTGGWPLDVD